MKFSEIIEQARSLLQRKGRMSYSALKIEFDLDDAGIDALKEELLFSYPEIEEAEGRGLVWTDDQASSGERQATPSIMVPPTGDSAHHPRSAERRQITVVFCDLVGSTALSERLDPEDLRELMADYQKVAGSVIERYAGHVAQYLGDGIMAYFGWPAAHEDDAGHAVRASLALVDAVTSIEADTPLAIRIGIATGPMVVGETGAGDASVPKAAVGETPNLAARLQGLAGPNEIVIAPTTHELVGGAFEYADLGQLNVKGITQALRPWRVLRISSVEGPFEARTMGRLTPFVGREIEITVLLERWAEANDGEGQVVLLSGEPGIGKSRITRELQQRLAAEPHTWLHYQGAPSYTNTAFYPVIDHFERAAGFARDDTPESRLDKLEALLKRRADNVAETAPLFASLKSLPLDRYLPLALSPQQQKEKTFQVLADQMLEFARHKPVLLVVEDAHWIDPTTLDVISTIIDQLHNAAILLVVTYRPEFEPPWHSYSNVTVHSLNRLSRRQGVHMLAKLVGEKKLSADVLDQIIAKTDGIPLFVEELTKTVLDTGHRAVDSIAAISATLQDSLMARLDRLALGKEIVQICACIGREFSYSLIAAVADDDVSDLNDALTKLIDAELLYQRGRPPNATYSFKHALVQETAYQSLLKTRRQQIHGRIAHALQTQFSEIVAAEPELMA
jgi:class 3 adenylate cyclase